MMYDLFTGSCEYEKALGKSGKYHAKVKHGEPMKTPTTINCSVKEAWESRCGTDEIENTFRRNLRTRAKFKHFWEENQ